MCGPWDIFMHTQMVWAECLKICRKCNVIKCPWATRLCFDKENKPKTELVYFLPRSHRIIYFLFNCMWNFDWNRKQLWANTQMQNKMHVSFRLDPISNWWTLKRINDKIHKLNSHFPNRTMIYALYVKWRIQWRKLTKQNKNTMNKKSSSSKKNANNNIPKQ